MFVKTSSSILSLISTAYSLIFGGSIAGVYEENEDWLSRDATYLSVSLLLKSKLISSFESSSTLWLFNLGNRKLAETLGVLRANIFGMFLVEFFIGF